MVNRKNNAAPDQHVRVAADAVIFTVKEGRLNVLLAQVRRPVIYAGEWALPGGLIADDETTKDAVRRVLDAHCGVHDAHVEQLAIFDAVDRDPRSRAVSVAYMALMPDSGRALEASSKYSDVRWCPVARLPKLAYDHGLVVATAVDCLRGKLAWSNIAWSLLPREFTLSDLQALYESILGRSLDKRNFRKKILAVGVVKATGHRTSGGAHRPAELYCFASRSLVPLNLLG